MDSPNRWQLLTLGVSGVLIATLVALPKLVEIAPIPLAEKALAPRADPPALPERANPIADQRHELSVQLVHHVVDALGQPVAGLAVRDVRTGVHVHSDDEGRCALDNGLPVDSTAEVVVATVGWQRIQSPLFELCLLPHTLVVAPVGEVFGIVVGDDGQPVPDAQLTWEIDVMTAKQEVLRGVRLDDWRTSSTARGEFTFEGVPVGSSTRLRIRHPTCLPLVIEAPATETRLVVRLQSTASQAPIVGQLLDAAARPIADAKISSGPEQTRSDQQGQFSLCAWNSESAVIHVVAEGFALLTTSIPPPVGNAEQSLELRLRAITEVTGCLVDANGHPCAAWWVALANHHSSGTCDEARFVEPPIRATSDGRFACQGVEGSNYCIEAWSPDNAMAVRSAPVFAPTKNLLVTASGSSLPARIRGCVRSRSGESLANLLVGLARPTAWAVRCNLAMHAGARGRTDEQGRFEIETGGVAALDLLIEGATCALQRVPIEPLQAMHSLDVRVRDASRIQIPEPCDLASATLLAVDFTGALRQLSAVSAPYLGTHSPSRATVVYDVPWSTRAIAVVTASQEIGRLLLDR